MLKHNKMQMTLMAAETEHQVYLGLVVYMYCELSYNAAIWRAVNFWTTVKNMSGTWLETYWESYKAKHMQWFIFAAKAKVKRKLNV